MQVARANRPGENLEAHIALRPWYRADLATFVRVYRNKRWSYGWWRSAVLAFYVSRLELQ
jgi:hypothetical protein